MTVSIGGLVFDGATGTPYPRLPLVQAAAWATSAKAYRFPGQVRMDQGTMSAWIDIGEADALAFLRAASSLVGYQVSVIYPHGTITPLSVASVDGQWQAARGTVNGGVLVVRFVFNSDADKDEDISQRSLVKVQTAPTLGGAWTDQAQWACFTSADGLGTYAGEAEAIHRNNAPDPTMLGKWVRLVLVGTVTPVWVGVIVGCGAEARRDPKTGAGWGGQAVYQFAGVAHAMAQLWAPRWLEARQATTSEQEGASVGGFADTSAPLSFNLEGAGNASSATFAPNGEAPPIQLHARGMLDIAETFTGDVAFRVLRAQFLKAYPTMPALVMSAPDLATMSGWTDRYVRNQGSLLDMVAQLIGPDMGYTFRLVADSVADTITVQLVDLAAAGATYDLTTEDAAIEWSMRLDAMQTVDRWYVDAGRRTYLATLKAAAAVDDGRLVKGWTLAQEAAWDAATNRDKLDITQVWRRWTLRHDWAGETFNSNQVPYTRDVDGGGQETGELETLAPTPEDYPDGPTAWKVERTIPTGPGKDWTAGGPSAAKAAPQTQRDGPLFWFVKAGQPWEPLHYDLQVTVGDKYASIMLGRNAADGATIKAKFTAGYFIYGTLSMIHPKSYRASALQAEARTDMPRTGVTTLPSGQVARIDVQPDTVIRLDDAGQPQYANPGRKDRGASVSVVRDRFRRWYQTPDGGATWKRNDVDVMTPNPGDVVAALDVIIQSGTPPTTATVAIGSPVARRIVQWDRYDPSVTWTASRIAPNITADGKGGAVVMAGGQAAGFRRTGQDGGPSNG